MKDLIALVEVVSKNKVKEIEILGAPLKDKNPTNLQRLYNGIYSGEIKNEEDIINTIFSNSKNASLYCSRLKGQLRERLINTLFFIDLNQNNFNDYSRAYYTCYKMASAIRILIGRNARNAAYPLAEKTLELALKFDFTDIALTVARDLRMQFATISGLRDKYENINNILNIQNQTLLAELKAEQYYTDVMINLVKIKAAKPEFAGKLISYVEELELLSKTITSYRFNYFTYIIRSLRFEVVGDYKNMLPVCKEALAYFFQKKSMAPNNVIFSFYLRMLVCLIHLKDFQEAKKVVDQCSALVEEGVYNWYVVQNYRMILAFFSGNFQEAYEVGQEALANLKLKIQDERTIEFWKIHEAYLFYLININKIKPDNRNPVKKFRLSKFLNDVPIYRKDKTGANVTIIVLQILFLLGEKRYDLIIDRIESLKTYTQRYLRNDDTFRSNCFIRMLIVMAENSFNKNATIRKAEKYWDKLREKPVNIVEQSAEIELIPYEMLWTFILESLDEKWH